MIKPEVLKEGDTIGIITPSTPAPVKFKQRYERGLRFLQKLGYEIVEGSCSNKSQAYRSGTIKDRVNEFNELIHNPEVKAIISTIGGTNSNSLLPYMDYEYLKDHPKIIMGYSDVTSLLLGIYTKIGLVTFYGPAIIPSFGEYPDMLPKGVEYFKNIVTKQKSAPYTLEIPNEWTDEMLDWNTQTRAKKMYENRGWTCLRKGKASGKLVGGNLNTMSGFLNSQYFPDLTGSILFIEDSYKDMALEERLFSMLKVSGIFDKISGLIVGKHEQFDDLNAPFTLNELLLEVIGDTNIPILTNVDIGHTFPSHVFPIGINIELDAEQGKITFMEDGVL
ncbi:Muramoyltetrapeptide carboxypeptidase LdcA (peptidoglycan recycling) [Salinibacillus kushneri]|uniref:Muramoyltetrapeptide carboxypeptidase LdcA (Peptidoglycan recycling) n=1 Tax=Salinibacillus kushneri TaxID=237682 RepID=A0A1I0AJ30_9BACI|nr:S66 peptidase family protein [Salinibacillus kushneri]SES94335.1 Muramoyltetrapeptide carboxypeptidase LdcA (peptidoglycan recycling) [Salinibacillus kushneri]